MCAIVGALFDQKEAVLNIETNLRMILRKSRERGRDGIGWKIVYPDGESTSYRRNHGEVTFPRMSVPLDKGTLIANLRAEPTTEYVRNKNEYDQQPYSLGDWSIVHNGTIANDKELRTYEHPTTIDSAAIVETLHRSQCSDPYMDFEVMVSVLKGSYAILAINKNHPDTIFAACNYRPIWYCKTPNGTFIASSRDYLSNLHPFVPEMLPPYSTAIITAFSIQVFESMPVFKKALVICSGGMDSVVAATYCINMGIETELVHFRYGSRAEEPEVKAIKAVADHLGIPATIVPMPIYKPEHSPLLRSDSKIAGGEAGAEFAHEWVPARNLVMLAIATARAEANGFDTIVLGNNLEEAGAYPDNEPEFIHRFNDLLPFAVGDGKKVRVLMPVGNFMKHEIVALGHKLKAPLHLTWSCYRAGPMHCGTCGPCFMRRTAFEINHIPECIPYANEEGT